MRVYLPATSRDLTGEALSPRLAHAVTAALRAELPDEDEEGWEACATLCAADSSLRMLAAVPGAADARIVIAADVPDEAVRELPVSDDVLPGTVEVTAQVPWTAVAAVLADEAEAAADVRAARAGDEESFERAADADLLWYDLTERLALARLLGERVGE